MTRFVVGTKKGPKKGHVTLSARLLEQTATELKDAVTAKNRAEELLKAAQRGLESAKRQIVGWRSRWIKAEKRAAANSDRAGRADDHLSTEKSRHGETREELDAALYERGCVNAQLDALINVLGMTCRSGGKIPNSIEGWVDRLHNTTDLNEADSWQLATELVDNDVVAPKSEGDEI